MRSIHPPPRAHSLAAAQLVLVGPMRFLAILVAIIVTGTLLFAGEPELTTVTELLVSVDMTYK